MLRGEDYFSGSTNPCTGGGIYNRTELWTFPIAVPFKMMAFRDLLVTAMSQTFSEHKTVLEISWSKPRRTY